MDGTKQEEMQFLGLFGICKETYKIIILWRKIFSQIFLILVLPSCFLLFIDAQVSHNVFFEQNSTKYWLFKAAFFNFIFIFSLLLKSVVAYTIACIYNGSKVKFKRVMGIIPRVWKKVMITNLCLIAAMILYVVACVVTFPFILFMISVDHFKGSLVIPLVITVLICVGFQYLSVVWALASVVSVLEDAQGIEAMKKSMALITGKSWIAFVIFSTITALSVVLQLIIAMLVKYGSQSLSMVSRVSLGVTCFLLFSNLILFSEIIQIVVYFVCKSYHHEEIDKSIVYHVEEHVPLKAKDVQHEQFCAV